MEDGDRLPLLPDESLLQGLGPCQGEGQDDHWALVSPELINKEDETELGFQNAVTEKREET